MTHSMCEMNCWCFRNWLQNALEQWVEAHVTRLVDMCDMTHSYEWSESLMFLTLNSEFSRTSAQSTGETTCWYVWYDSFVCVSWIVDVSDIDFGMLSNNYGSKHKWNDLLICVIWLIRMSEMHRWCFWRWIRNALEQRLKALVKQLVDLLYVMCHVSCVMCHMSRVIRVIWPIRTCEMNHWGSTDEGDRTWNN